MTRNRLPFDWDDQEELRRRRQRLQPGFHAASSGSSSNSSYTGTASYNTPSGAGGDHSYKVHNNHTKKFKEALGPYFPTSDPTTHPGEYAAEEKVLDAHFKGLLSPKHEKIHRVTMTKIMNKINPAVDEILVKALAGEWTNIKASVGKNRDEPDHLMATILRHHIAGLTAAATPQAPGQRMSNERMHLNELLDQANKIRAENGDPLIADFATALPILSNMKVTAGPTSPPTRPVARPLGAPTGP